MLFGSDVFRVIFVCLQWMKMVVVSLAARCVTVETHCGHVLFKMGHKSVSWKILI